MYLYVRVILTKETTRYILEERYSMPFIQICPLKILRSSSIVTNRLVYRMTCEWWNTWHMNTRPLFYDTHNTWVRHIHSVSGIYSIYVPNIDLNSSYSSSTCVSVFTINRPNLSPQCVHTPVDWLSSWNRKKKIWRKMG